MPGWEIPYDKTYIEYWVRNTDKYYVLLIVYVFFHRRLHHSLSLSLFSLFLFCYTSLLCCCCCLSPTPELSPFAFASSCWTPGSSAASLADFPGTGELRRSWHWVLVALSSLERKQKENKKKPESFGGFLRWWVHHRGCLTKVAATTRDYWWISTVSFAALFCPSSQLDFLWSVPLEFCVGCWVLSAGVFVVWGGRCGEIENLEWSRGGVGDRFCDHLW